MGLVVPLPLPYELYQSDFETWESMAEFRELVGKADYYFELPMRFGTLEELARKTPATPIPCAISSMRWSARMSSNGVMN